MKSLDGALGEPGPEGAGKGKEGGGTEMRREK